jgi:hypothetical protein
VNRTIGVLQWVFLLIGAGLLVGAGLVASRTQSFLAGAESAPGKVVGMRPHRSDRGTTYAPVVEFQPASGARQTFEESTSTSPPAYRLGEAVEVLYDPSDPTDARLRGLFSLWGGSLILGGIGAVFALVGGGMLLSRRAARRSAEDLRLRGRRVQARFQAVERNGALRVNGRSPWRITCQWVDPATGLLHVFRSENLWFDPTDHIRTSELTVFVDPRNPKRHHVDLSFLPKLAP